MKRLSYVWELFLIAILFFSCEKTPESYLNKNIDVNLIGGWCKTYSTRDSHNSITIFTDTIQFILNNSGSQRIYKFSELENSFSFQYYTADDLVFIRPEGNEDAFARNYHIQNDSLFFSGGATYVKCINN